MTEKRSSIKKTGLPPGTLIHVGEQKSDNIRITSLDYNKSELHESEHKSTGECADFLKKGTVSWINVDGLHDTDAIASIGALFDLHPLLLEDVLNTGHRPKLEEFDNCLFITLKMLGISEDGNSVVSEQVSFVLGDTWVISFQERQGDIFDAIRQRISEGKGVIREKGVDYLMYRLIDIVVDHYFLVTDYFNEVIMNLEEKVLHTQDDSTMREIQRLKKEVSNFRRAVFPLREVVSSMQRGDHHLIKKSTLRFLQDVYEHIINVNDIIEIHREMLNNIMDLHMSGISNRMNQVMKVLTIMSTIFIPLTFIAGIYGMNFQHMPELGWKYGYHTVWVLMLVIALTLVIVFRRKRWL